MSDEKSVIDEEIHNMKHSIRQSDNYEIIDWCQIHQAINSTNPNGASGYDNITQPLLHSDMITNSRILEIMFQTWTQMNHIPAFFKIGAINSIPKRKITSQPKEFRPITLLPIIYKVFERVILNKLLDLGVEASYTPCKEASEKTGVLEQLGTTFSQQTQT